MKATRLTEKQELINTLFEEFDKDKEVIKKNLLKTREYTGLSITSGNTKITLAIGIKKIEKENK